MVRRVSAEAEECNVIGIVSLQSAYTFVAPLVIIIVIIFGWRCAHRCYKAEVEGGVPDAR